MFTDFYVIGYKILNGEYLYFGVDDNGNKRWITNIIDAVWFNIEQDAKRFADNSSFVVKDYEIITVEEPESEHC